MKYTAEYNKTYKTVEEMEERQSIYTANVEHINEHNDSESPNYLQKVTKFADWTPKEKEKILVLLGPGNSKPEIDDDVVIPLGPRNLIPEHWGPSDDDEDEDKSIGSG